MPPNKKAETTVTARVSPISMKNETEEGPSETNLEVDTSGEMQSEIGNKRSNTSNKPSTPAKKARSKPQPQIIENMKEYFDNNTLDQLTTATLRYWLKEKQLHCTTRERKEHLIQKVRKHYLEGTL